MIQSSSARWLVGIAVFAGMLIVASILLSVLLGGEDDLLLAETPEGTVQRYLRALNDNDYSAAYGYISKDLEPGCTLQHFISTSEYMREQGFGAELTRTTSANGSRLVTVEITEGEFNPPFGGGQYSFNVTFMLEQQDGEWRMAEPPWPMSWCPPQRETPTPAETPRTALYGPSAEMAGKADTGGRFKWNS